jgi:hypothetical protein
MIISFIYRVHLSFSFPICIPFISFSCVSVLRIQAFILRVKTVDTIRLSFSLLSKMLAVGLLQIAFIMLKYDPSSSNFPIMKGC